MFENVPFGQICRIADAPLQLDPIGHTEHTVSDVFVHATVMYWPGAHTLQVRQFV
jgi:hypothetical protein